MQYVADVLTERGWPQGCIGVETDSWYFTARAYHELTRSLPQATLVDA